MPVPYDSSALAYYCKCPCCFAVHLAVSHSIAILGTDWHKKECPFVNPGGLYVTFNAFPIMNERHKYFRQLTPEWQKFFIEQRDKRLKMVQGPIK